MLAFFWAATAALALCAAQDQNVEVTIDTRMNPERIVSVLNKAVAGLPEGLRVRALITDRAVSVSGNAAAVRKAQEIVRLLDIAPRRLDMRVRLIRINRVDGRSHEEVLSDLRTVGCNNIPLSITGSDPDWETEAQITPRVNGDGSVSVRCAFRFTLDGQTRSRFDEANRRLAAGKSLVVTFARGDRDLTHAESPDAGFAMAPQYAYRVEVTGFPLQDAK